MNGMGISLKKVNKLNFALITFVYAIIIFMLLFVISFSKSLLYGILNQYIAEIVGILGLFALLAGIFTIKNWKSNKEITYLNNFAYIAPVICGVVGVISAYSLLIGPNSQYNIELMLIIFFGILITNLVAFYFSKYLKKLEKPYPIIVSNFMVLVGFFFIMFAAFIPNLATLSNMHMSPLYLKSTDYVFFLVLAVVGIFLCGVFITKHANAEKNHAMTLK